MKKNLFKCFVIGLMLSSVCFAEPETENIREVLKSSSYEPNYFSILMSLVFVIFLIYVTGIIYTKLNKFGVNTVKNEIKENSDIKPVVLSTTPIGHDKVLQVIEINGERLLIGLAPNSVSYIKSLGRASQSNYQQDMKQEEQTFSKTEVETKTTEEHIVNEDDFGLYKKYLR